MLLTPTCRSVVTILSNAFCNLLPDMSCSLRVGQLSLYNVLRPKCEQYLGFTKTP